MKYEQTWQLRAADGEWFPARVPGNIQYDYAVAHGFGDFCYGENHRKFDEIEGFEWEYRCSLQYTQNPGERVFFVSRGIDYFFDIAVNGQVIYRHEGMFTITELDITDYLTGSDTLSVFVHPHPIRPDVRVGREQASASCKPAIAYKWSSHPRLLPSGIWDETYIETRTAAHIRSAEVRYTLNADFTRADIHVDIDCDADCTLTLCDAEGQVVYCGGSPDFMLENPHLWWCNGQGEPYLYRWSVKSASDEKTGTVGFRRVELVMNEGAWKKPAGFPKSRSDSPAAFRLNGRYIFAKGSNWVLPEIFPGNLDGEMISRYLTLAHDAHMNILRCQGASGINKDIFYAECDRLGIMVFMEFPLACNNYPDDPHYLRILEQEATAIILRLRPHVSVSLWCGGNELFNSWSGMTEQSLPLRLLDKLCYELSPERPFIMTSPLNGMVHGGYMLWDFKENCDCFTLFQKSRATAYSEFGISATPNADLLRAIIPEDELFPPKPGGSWEAHGAFNAWHPESWLQLDVIERYRKPKNLEELVEASQWLQSEGLKAIFEEARRQWPYCAMAMSWCLTEPWTNAANNSIIAYPCVPKAAYYAVAESLRGVLFSARIPRFEWKAGEIFRAEIWMLNDTQESAKADVEVELELDGVVYEQFTWHGKTKAAANTVGPSVNMKLPTTGADTLILRLKAGEYSSEYRLAYSAPYYKPAPKIMNIG
ncbi:MAG: hypothetical protein IKD37_01350 [Clostridia bacterium]|nr:hypothetical protein [Clostridia bacterium]